MPITVTVCAVLHVLSSALKVRVRVLLPKPRKGFSGSASSPSSCAPAGIDSTTVTSAAGLRASATVKVSVPPASAVTVEPPVSTTTSPAAASSSALVTDSVALVSPP